MKVVVTRAAIEWMKFNIQKMDELEKNLPSVEFTNKIMDMHAQNEWIKNFFKITDEELE